MEERKQSVRIQTSILNAAEKKVLVWIANRLPEWVSSDMMTWLGVVGAVLCGLGFALTNYSIYWLWLSIFGLFFNWFGDSLDGTIARVRNQQRPLYGYYLDHNVDVICEFFVFVGIGLSPLLHLSIALLAYTAYLGLTVYVSINAHLKDEFKLTYGKMGPTELRLIIMIVCLLFMYIPALTAFHGSIQVFDKTYEYGLFDIIGLVIWFLLAVIYLHSFIQDAVWFAKKDPLKKHE
ncbi:MAG: CDP-alcohol phosphatidyltransferase family protein [Paludibacteraceae bacterium]|nr:CDP-alcohol phosphatidyltransferase family protein [Paludibacteraceae bacterium]